MLTNLKTLLPIAQKEGYAVGLFNTVNLEMAKGVLAAAEQCRSPVIIGTAEVLLPFAELKEITPLLRDMAERATVPVVLHYDHGISYERVCEALRLGFSSVMYDCSALPYEENVRKMAEMARIAEAFGATLEAELGHIGSAEDAVEGNGMDEDSIYTDPKQVPDFLERTGAHCLAVAIGTAHGAYKHKPKLDIARLAEIRAITSVPLALHGGSGLSDQDFIGTIAAGIAKVNIFTDIDKICAAAAYNSYRQGMGMTGLMGSMEQAVKDAVIEKMQLFGSVNRV